VAFVISGLALPPTQFGTQHHDYRDDNHNQRRFFHDLLPRCGIATDKKPGQKNHGRNKNDDGKQYAQSHAITCLNYAKSCKDNRG
jgi:hypothetical protein